MKEKFKIDKYKIAIIIILIIGIAVRVINLNKVPNGLNVDEASSAYEAYAIGNYGIDRNGKSFPVFLISWGSGQNALYSYILIPFVKLFGLNTITTRLPMVIISSISLIVFYELLKLLKNKKLAIIGLTFFAICPWHIMKSRWGLESNIFPDLVLWAVYFIILGLHKNNEKLLKNSEENLRQIDISNSKKSITESDKIISKKSYNWIIYIGFAVLGISAYSYSTSYFFLPIFVMPLLIYLVIKKELKWWQALICLLIVGTIAFPIILYVLINTFNLNEIKLFGIFTVPKLTSNRMKLLSSVFADNPIIGSLKNFAASMEMLIKQSDTLPWNALDGYGTIYVFSIFFTIIGIIKCFYNKITRNANTENEEATEKLKNENKKINSKKTEIFKEKSNTETHINEINNVEKNVMNIWFIAAILLLFVCEPNINRVNILFIPVIYYTVCGIYEIVNTSKIALIVVGIIYAICFGMFLNKYVNTNLSNYTVFQDGLDEVYEYVGEIENSNENENTKNNENDIDSKDLNNTQNNEGTDSNIENIYIEYFYKEPYIYTLFYTHEDPNVFYKTAKRKNEKGSFDNIVSYGKYKYYLPDEIKPEKGTIYILKNNGQAEKYNTNEWNVKEFEKYIVLSSKN